MEIPPESPVMLYGILSILFSFLLFSLPRHCSFLFLACTVPFNFLYGMTQFLHFL